jgi:hypothetical protein
MKKYVRIFRMCIFVFGSLLYIGCSDEISDSVEPVEIQDATIYIQGFIPFAGETHTVENDIRRVRFVALASSQASESEGTLICNQLHANPQETIKQIVRTGYRDIYLIVNEPLNNDYTEKDIFKNINSKADLEKIQLEYARNPDFITMFKSYPNTYVQADGSTVVGEEVERVMAKVNFTLNYDYADLSKRIIIDSVRMERLPKHSYLFSKPYVPPVTGDHFIKSENVVIDAGNSIASSESFTIPELIFYVPEYILSDTLHYAYLKIDGHIENTSTQVTYLVRIGDGMNPIASGSERYDITRNREYIFVGQLKGYGGLMDVEADIKDWDPTDIDVDDTQYRLIVGHGSYMLGNSSFEGRLSIYTNHPGGWEAAVDESVTWLSLSGQTTGKTGVSGLNFKVESNGTGLSRSGVINLRSGNLRKLISVYQPGKSFYEVPENVLETGNNRFMLMMGDATPGSWSDYTGRIAGQPVIGYSDWRLPSITELKAMYRYFSSFEEEFESYGFSRSVNDVYWSATDGANESEAQGIYFNSGSVSSWNKSINTFKVRYVRSY